MCGHLVEGGRNETHPKWWLTLGFARPELLGSCMLKGRALRPSLQEQYLTCSDLQAAFEARDMEHWRCPAGPERRATATAFGSV